MLSSHLSSGLPSDLFPSGFPRKNMFLIYRIRATCPVHPIPVDLITLIIFSGEYKLRSSLCNFFQPPVTCHPP
jgi:hypothetical protein